MVLDAAAVAERGREEAVPSEVKSEILAHKTGWLMVELDELVGTKAVCMAIDP